MSRTLLCGLALAVGAAAGCEYPAKESTYGKNVSGGKPAGEPTAADRKKQDVIDAANGLIRQLHQKMSVLPATDPKKQKYDALVKLKNDSLDVDADKFDAAAKKLTAAIEEVKKLAGDDADGGGGRPRDGRRPGGDGD